MLEDHNQSGIYFRGDPRIARPSMDCHERPHIPLQCTRASHSEHSINANNPLCRHIGSATIYQGPAFPVFHAVLIEQEKFSSIPTRLGTDNWPSAVGVVANQKKQDVHSLPFRIAPRAASSNGEKAQDWASRNKFWSGIPAGGWVSAHTSVYPQHIQTTFSQRWPPYLLIRVSALGSSADECG